MDETRYTKTFALRSNFHPLRIDKDKCLTTDASERERDDKWRGKCIGGRKSLSSELTIVSTNFATQRFATFPENYFKLHKPVKLYNPGHFLELIPSKYLLDTRGGGGEGGVFAAVVIVEQIYIYIYRRVTKNK